MAKRYQYSEKDMKEKKDPDSAIKVTTLESTNSKNTDENKENEKDSQDTSKEKSKTIQEILETSPEKRSDNLPNIPTPFKKMIFWKTPTEEKAKTLIKPKEKTPSVIVSETWRQYEQRKLDKKQREQEDRDRRKMIRLENKDQKSIRSRSKAEKKHSSSNEEQAKELSTQKKTYSIGNYVIVKYNEVSYPGCILQYDEKIKEYTVKAMTPSGNNWKWPTREDVLTYKPCDIICKIKEPKLINKRGIYDVPEVQDVQ